MKDYYKYSNKRIIARDNKGRFKKTTLEDLGFEINTTYLICQKCGYGEIEKWTPLLKTGSCPKCGNQGGHKEKEFVLSKKAKQLIKEVDSLKYEIGITKSFIDPIKFNTHKGKLDRLEVQLKNEIRKCIEDSFDR